MTLSQETTPISRDMALITSMNNRVAPRRLAMLAFPEVQMLDVTGPLEVFSVASRVLEM